MQNVYTLYTRGESEGVYQNNAKKVICYMLFRVTEQSEWLSDVRRTILVSKFSLSLRLQKSPDLTALDYCL